MQIPRKLERVTITRKPEARAADAPKAAMASARSHTYYEGKHEHIDIIASEKR